jgi:hypothetical protein
LIEGLSYLNPQEFNKRANASLGYPDKRIIRSLPPPFPPFNPIHYQLYKKHNILLSMKPHYLNLLQHPCSPSTLIAHNNPQCLQLRQCSQCVIGKPGLTFPPIFISISSAPITTGLFNSLIPLLCLMTLRLSKNCTCRLSCKTRNTSVVKFRSDKVDERGQIKYSYALRASSRYKR